MQKQLEKIEQRLMALYAEIQKEMPELHCLNLAISQIDKNSEPYLYGFVHIGEDCRSIRDINQIYDLWHRHQILFQKFNLI